MTNIIWLVFLLIPVFGIWYELGRWHERKAQIAFIDSLIADREGKE